MKTILKIMKKIGILTFHYVDNYGAVLQCYALQKVINKLPHCEAKIINYIPSNFQYYNYWKTQYGRRLFGDKRVLFKEFLFENCTISEKVCCQVLDEKYDYYCVGSDQIWNTGADVVEYFLPNLNEEKQRISYAASIGCGINSKKLRVDIFEKYIPHFKALSVREEEHVEFIEKISNKKCKWVLDPTLLLTVQDYQELVSKECLEEKEFIFFFWLSHEDNILQGIEIVNNMARKWGYKIIHSIVGKETQLFVGENRCMMYEGIDAFLWYIQNARFVVTNSYHATLFSIQFRVPFYTLLVHSMKSRIETLCHKIGIEDRVVEGYLPLNKITDRIDFDMIYDKIALEKEMSMKYLKDALDIE